MINQATVYLVGANAEQTAQIKKTAEQAGLAFQIGFPEADDPLTHLKTFTVFEKEMIDALKQAQESEPVSIALIHLDQFPIINRSYGHMCGDLILIELANLLKESLPNHALAARYSGAQLAALFPRTNAGDVQSWAQKMVEKVRNYAFRAVAVGEKITVTVGVVCYPSMEVNQSEQLLEVLTARTYRGMEAGGDRVVS